MALTLFAHIAAPQVRLTSDPNTFLFFLDHLGGRPPFRLEDDTSWDTNIALGIEWGLRLIDKDEELRGRSPNARQFVLLSDGQAWSGVVEDAVMLTRERDVPIFVVGVGTPQGGIIPDPERAADPARPPVTSALDRAPLNAIAAGSAGRYLELDREPDIVVATRIIDAARRRAVASTPEPALQPVHWQFLVAAAGTLGFAVLFLRDRAELWIAATGGTIVLAALASLLRS
jgi:hypothetical protein